jgi:membrane protease YdiL (CAAX protease family)
MTRKSPATLSAILTVIILVILAVIFTLLQMVVLNGASERQGLTAMGISLGCQSLIILMLATLASRATTFLITKVEWNSILAVVVTVTVAATIGGVISFLASIVAIPVAGIG